MSTTPRSIEAVVFDLDDTLYPEREFVLSGFRAVGRWLADRGAPGDFAAVARALHESGVRGRVFDEALARLGLDAGPDAVRRLVEIYRAHDPEIRLFDDAAWALDRLAGRVRLGLITDGYLDTQRRKVAALGIAPRFDALVYSDEHGRDCWKPSPVPYRAVADALGCDAGRCVYVADNPAKDFVTARALGWATVQVVRDGGEYACVAAQPGYEPDARVGSLRDLEATLVGLVAPGSARGVLTSTDADMVVPPRW